MGQWNYPSPVTYLKATLFAYNITYWTFGASLLGVALWAEVHIHQYLQFSLDLSGTSVHLILTIAGFIVSVCSFAFLPIIKGQVVMLHMYGGLLGCVLVVNVGVNLSVLCFWETFRRSLHDGLTRSMMETGLHKANFDYAQRFLRCCGVSNYTDWTTLSPQKVIPVSCCVDLANCVTANYNDVYQLGCYEKILSYVDQNMAFIFTMAICTAVMPSFGVILTCYLVHHIKKNKAARARVN